MSVYLWSIIKHTSLAAQVNSSLIYFFWPKFGPCMNFNIPICVVSCYFLAKDTAYLYLTLAMALVFALFSAR
jgi:hypothetical protein